MRTVFLLFDSLNRHALGCYGGTAIPTPNIDRLAARGVRFDNHWAGSLPCMPARREMHTGRMNFLHRSWGPLEPFDDSFAKLLDGAGVHTHLVTDHYHYWEEGGCGYHNQYSSFEFHRGQEKDRWQGVVDRPLDRWCETYHHVHHPKGQDADLRAANLANRDAQSREEDYSLVGTITDAIAFLDANRDSDDWLLNVECFDPHEPFTAPERFRAGFPTGYDGPILDLPFYDRVTESAEEIDEVKANYAALLVMCDHYLGRLLDYFDTHDLWADTALILTTDHGILLAEHDWWGKMRMPFFKEIAQIPLIIYHPDQREKSGEVRTALTASIDIMPTLLDLHGVNPPADVKGQSLLGILSNGPSAHDACLFGMFGAAVNITDGRYTYFLYPEDFETQELYEYTLMPTHMRSHFAVEEMREATLSPPFDFTKDAPVLRIPARMTSKHSPLKGSSVEDRKTALFDLHTDPGQTTPIVAPDVTARLTRKMIRIMRDHDAPGEAFRRLGLPVPDGLTHA